MWYVLSSSAMTTYTLEQQRTWNLLGPTGWLPLQCQSGSESWKVLGSCHSWVTPSDAGSGSALLSTGLREAPLCTSRSCEGGVWTHDCCLWPPRGHFWTSALALTHPKNVEIVECEVHCWNTLVFEAGSSSVDRLAWNSQEHNYLYLAIIRFKGVCHHVWLLTGF